MPFAILEDIEIVAVHFRHVSPFQCGRYFSAASILAIPIGREAGGQANAD
jgi:hypothetical protein